MGFSDNKNFLIFWDIKKVTLWIVCYFESHQKTKNTFPFQALQGGVYENVF